MDAKLRELERQAATGDIEAEKQLLANQCRIREHCWKSLQLPIGGLGQMTPALHRFAKDASMYIQSGLKS